LAHAPEALHQKLSADYSDLIYAAVRRFVQAFDGVGGPRRLPQTRGENG
jgi:hypothetical protein